MSAFAVGQEVVVESTYTAFVVRDDGGPDVEVQTRHDRLAGTGVTQPVDRETVEVATDATCDLLHEGRGQHRAGRVRNAPAPDDPPCRACAGGADLCEVRLCCTGCNHDDEDDL